MVTLKGHFDGKSIVLDEPATLAVGQAVRVVVDPPSGNKTLVATTDALESFDPDAASALARQLGDDFDERDVLNQPSRTPPGFVRRPGSGAGEIWTSDDFDETPEEFKDYM